MLSTVCVGGPFTCATICAFGTGLLTLKKSFIIPRVISDMTGDKYLSAKFTSTPYYLVSRIFPKLRRKSFGRNNILTWCKSDIDQLRWLIENRRKFLCPIKSSLLFVSCSEPANFGDKVMGRWQKSTSFPVSSRIEELWPRFSISPKNQR